MSRLEVTGHPGIYRRVSNGAFVVRFLDREGKSRKRTFDSERAALAFKASLGDKGRRDRPTIPPPRGSALGSVYFVQAGVDGPVKIGWARDVRERLKTLQTANDASLELRASLPGGRDLESTIHAAFRADRIRREWFEPAVLEQLEVRLTELFVPREL